MYALDNGLFGIFREGTMIDDILMQVIPEEVSTCRASMSVINGKKAGLNIVFINIQYDTHSVLIVVSGNSLVGIDGV